MKHIFNREHQISKNTSLKFTKLLFVLTNYSSFTALFSG